MIRKYKNDDLEILINIWHEASGIAHPFLKHDFVEKVKQDLRELYIPNSETWVYETNGVVIGFIGMIKNEIGGLFVLPKDQSKGVGTLLVNFVREIYKDLEVEVFEKNKIGRAFYNKYGFKPLSKNLHEESEQVVLRMRFEA